MRYIIKIHARQIFDSKPTTVDVITDNGVLGSCSTFGASTGEHEAVELRDGGKAYLGRRV
jgi:enolase